jgi:hypothetical protein
MPYKGIQKDERLRRYQVQPECNNGIGGQGVKQQLVLGSMGNVNKTFTHALVVKLAK